MRHGSSLGNHGLGELKPSRIGIISDHWLETNAQRGQRRDESYWQILGKPTEVTAVTLQGDRQRGTVQDDPRESQHISQRRPFKQTAGDAVTSTQAVKKFWLKYLFVGPVRSSCFKGRQLVSSALTPLRAQFSPDSGEEEALPSSLRHAHPAAHGWEAPNTAPWNWTQDLINEIRYFKQLPRNAKRGKGNWKRCFSPVPGQGQAAIPAPCLQPPRCGQEPRRSPPARYLSSETLMTPSSLGTIAAMFTTSCEPSTLLSRRGLRVNALGCGSAAMRHRRCGRTDVRVAGSTAPPPGGPGSRNQRGAGTAPEPGPRGAWRAGSGRRGEGQWRPEASPFRSAPGARVGLRGAGKGCIEMRGRPRQKRLWVEGSAARASSQWRGLQ